MTFVSSMTSDPFMGRQREPRCRGIRRRQRQCRSAARDRALASCALGQNRAHEPAVLYRGIISSPGPPLQSANGACAGFQWRFPSLLPSAGVFSGYKADQTGGRRAGPDGMPERGTTGTVKTVSKPSYGGHAGLASDATVRNGAIMAIKIWLTIGF
jgi:hypothetical protein